MRARFLIPVGLAALLAIPATARPQDDEKTQFLEQMLGVYTYDRGQKGDQTLTADELDGTVEILDDRMILRDPDGNELYVIEYAVPEVSNKTAKLRMEIVESTMKEAVGSKGQGLATLNSGTLTIIYDYEGPEYPDDFKPDGDDQHLFVMSKQDDS